MAETVPDCRAKEAAVRVAAPLMVPVRIVTSPTVSLLATLSVPPLIARAAASARTPDAPRVKVPALRLVAPVKVFAPERTSSPEPVFVSTSGAVPLARTEAKTSLPALLYCWTMISPFAAKVPPVMVVSFAPTPVVTRIPAPSKVAVPPRVKVVAPAAAKRKACATAASATAPDVVTSTSLLVAQVFVL